MGWICLAARTTASLHKRARAPPCTPPPEHILCLHRTRRRRRRVPGPGSLVSGKENRAAGPS